MQINMKKDTHPNYPEVNVTCSCGNKFKTQSTIGERHDYRSLFPLSSFLYWKTKNS